MRRHVDPRGDDRTASGVTAIFLETERSDDATFVTHARSRQERCMPPVGIRVIALPVVPMIMNGVGSERVASGQTGLGCVPTLAVLNPPLCD